MPVSIIGSATLVIAEHLVGFAQLLELIFRAVFLVDIRVILPCKPAIGLAYLVVRCTAFYLEYLVIVTLVYHE